MVALRRSKREFRAAQSTFMSILAANGCNRPVFFLSTGVLSVSVGGSVSGYSVSVPVSYCECFPCRVLSSCV